jgi:hypothetical protein
MGDLPGLRGATAGHDHWHRKKQNSGVEPQRAVLQIVQVVSQLAIQIVRRDAAVPSQTASMDLPPTGQAGDDRVAHIVGQTVVCYQLWKLGAWSDE